MGREGEGTNLVLLVPFLTQGVFILDLIEELVKVCLQFALLHKPVVVMVTVNKITIIFWGYHTYSLDPMPHKAHQF